MKEILIMVIFELLCFFAGILSQIPGKDRIVYRRDNSCADEAIKHNQDVTAIFKDYEELYANANQCLVELAECKYNK